MTKFANVATGNILELVLYS